MLSLKSASTLLVLSALILVNVERLSAQDKSAQSSGSPITIGEKWRLTSKLLREEREVQVFLPASYSASRQRFPVIYTLDGEGTGPITASAVQFMTGYLSIPQMPEAVVIAITNTNRNRDMPVPQEYGKGGEESFLSFLADELIPAVEQRYRTQPLRILVGHSQGGLFAHYALIARPSLFQWYLSIDAPLAGFSEVKPLMEKVKTVVKTAGFRGRLVSIENLYGWKKDWSTLAEAAPRTFYGEQVEIKDETHETMAFKAIYEGLKRLFHDYAPNLVKETKGIYTVPTLEQMYKDVSQAYGYQVDIPRQLLLASAAQNTAIQYGAEAIELVKRAELLYGESAATKRLLAEAEAAEKKGRDPRFAEWESLPPPSVDEIKPFLGAWVLSSDRGTESMIFAVKDGVVHAQCTITPDSGEPFQMSIQFVRVLDEKTLQWGVRNGRGSGIILRTVKVVNENTLEGTTEPVGIQYAPPPHPVTFKRKS